MAHHILFDTPGGRDAVVSYTVYDRPADYPHSVVVRRFDGARPTGWRWLFDDVDEARIFLRAFSPGLACVARDDSDPPSVVETWL